MTPPTDPFNSVATELDTWRRAGKTARLWLRDDDAMTTTGALERLLGLTATHHVPLLLAVIPMRAEQELARRLEHEKLVEVAMHGAWHRNNAPAGRKGEEMAPERGVPAIAADLKEARERLLDLFGTSAGGWYVPPWNRIAPEVAALLPSIGFGALSTFGTQHLTVRGLQVRNCQVDLIDWRGGRVGRKPEWVAEQLAAALANARANGFGAVGILTHHLDHDEITWSVLESLLALVATHPGASWIAISGDLPHAPQD